MSRVAADANYSRKRLAASGTMPWLLRLFAPAVGTCGAWVFLYRKWKEHDRPMEKNRELLRLAAVALSSEVVDNVLIRNETSLMLVKNLVRDVLAHSAFLNHLKGYVIAEFTTNKETVSALRKFVVEDIIRDPWVSDELISMAKETGREIAGDPEVYPNLVLSLLADAAVEGLRTDTFVEALSFAVKASLWKTFLGPSPNHMEQLNVR
uniref:Uncharacterized protein n=1 Tax=Trypanosoma congolense (strain IL3000) TaxID=1068625 RepID=G0UP03_TRYCI|nr:conserved hypothetical protein [Trypanosoma congolense IL3000]